MPKRQLKNPNSLRNLPQYRNLSDEEFNAKFNEIQSTNAFERETEEAIEKKLAEFAEDYDLSGMLINDKLILRSLIKKIIALEDYENRLSNLIRDGINESNAFLVDKLETWCSTLTKDISKLQDDLKITRRTRKSEKEESAIAFIDDLKVKAKKFYDQKHQLIFCPKCNTLLATVWWLYPDAKNSIVVKCQRKLDTDLKCDGEVRLTSAQIKETGGSNKLEIVPESMR